MLISSSALSFRILMGSHDCQVRWGVTLINELLNLILQHSSCLTSAPLQSGLLNSCPHFVFSRILARALAVFIGFKHFSGYTRVRHVACQ